MNKTVLYLLALLLAFLTACSTTEPDSVSVSKGVPSTINDDLQDEPDWEALEERLNGDLVSLMMPEALELVGGAKAVQESIVEGTIFKVKAKTWQGLTGMGGLIIEEHTPSGIVKENYAILMEDTNREWWIMATMDVEEARSKGLLVDESP